MRACSNRRCLAGKPLASPAGGTATARGATRWRWSRWSTPFRQPCRLQPFRAADHRAGAVAGRVEVLPLVAKGEPWKALRAKILRDPLTESRSEPRDERRLEEGRRVARVLPNWSVACACRRATAIGRPPGATMMILTRRRAAFAEIETALRELRIPFASARGGGLLDALEVQDILALLGFIAAPGDDLKLAQALKCPLFGAATPISPCWRPRADAACRGGSRLCGLVEPPAPLARLPRPVPAMADPVGYPAGARPARPHLSWGEVRRATPPACPPPPRRTCCPTSTR